MKNNHSNENTFTRTSIQDLEDYAMLIYEKVLLLYESAEFDKLSKIRIDGKAFTIPTKGKIGLVYNGTKKTVEACFEVQSNKWILKESVKANELNNKIYYISQGNKIKSLIRHIRNAFAHNLIILDNGYIIIGDFIPLKGETKLQQAYHAWTFELQIL